MVSQQKECGSSLSLLILVSGDFNSGNGPDV